MISDSGHSSSAGVLSRIPQLRNFSTKDKPGTLPLNYESAPPEQHSVDFDVLLNEGIPTQQDTSTTHINVVITQSRYAVVSRMYEPRSAPKAHCILQNY